MRNRLILMCVGILITLGMSTMTSQTKQDTLFYRSLHYTAGGMSYWYAKTNGGLETVTGVPYSQLGCQNCHVADCSRCHLTATKEGPAYSTNEAKQDGKCLGCHAREASVMKVDKAAGQLDVHFERGMACMDCHTAGEIHGNGTMYASMKAPGAMETSCEKCHTISESRAHSVHNGKLDCNACHERQVVSCTNCHFETMVNEGKRIALPVSGWLFLMNRNGKVTSANMQSFVMKEGRTFLMFAPQHSHSIMKQGRECEECHASDNVKQLGKKAFTLTWLQDGKLQNTKGVIPVTDGITWNMVYQDREKGQWVLIKNPVAPKLQYASFGEPLTRSQMQSLARLQTNEKK